MVVEALVDQLLNGLTIGVVYVLLAAGLSIVFGVMDVINFAHGELYALGAYFAFSVLTAAGDPNAFWVALLLAPAAVAVVGAGVERLTIRPLYGRNPLYHILLTFGLVLILKDVVEFVWGPGNKSYPVTPGVLQGQVAVAGFDFPRYSLFVIAVGSLMAAGTWYALNNTRVGLVVRAGAQDREMVRHLGIEVDRYYTLVFAFGAALAGLAGVVLAGRNGLEVAMGDSVIIPAFVIVVLGGLGSFRGAVVGGLVVGVVQTLTRSGVVAEVFAPVPVLGELAALLPALEGLVVFGLMIAVLLFRPRGLFGNPEWQSSEGEGDLLVGGGDALGPVWRRRLALGAVALLVVAPFGVGLAYDGFVVYSLLVSILVWALFAVSLDLVMGYAGLVSLGHVLFYGVGAYGTVLAADGRVTDLVAAVPAVGSPLAAGLGALGYADSLPLALLTGVAVAAAVAWVVGYLSIRVAGVYFAMITLGFAELFRQLVVKLPASWAGSTDGLYGAELSYSVAGVSLGEVGEVVLVEGVAVGPVVLAREVRLLYFVVLAGVVGGYLLARRVIEAPFGGVLTAIRESEARAQFLGYDVVAHKRRVFVLSGALAALAGGLQAVTGLVVGVGPSLLHWINSGEVIVMTVLGGMGTLYGPILGAAVFRGGQELLSTHTGQWRALLGLVFVLFVVFLPRGIVSLPGELRRRLRERGGDPPTGAPAETPAEPKLEGDD
jgi:branched-chain amino acid transport system permease protein